jgi:hypothetical protein
MRVRKESPNKKRRIRSNIEYPSAVNLLHLRARADGGEVANPRDAWGRVPNLCGGELLVAELQASTPIVGIAMGIIMPSIIMGCTSTSGMPSITAGGDGAQRLAWGDLMDQSRNNHWQYDILMQGHSGTSARLFCLLSLE